MKLHALFRSGVIFAAHKPIRVFGESTGAVTVTLDGATATVAPEDGAFLAELPPLPYGGPYQMTVTGDGETVYVENVYIGEVFLASGQSNMQYKMAAGAITKADCEALENVRFFSTRRGEGGERFKPEDGWVACTEETAPYFPAIPFYVAKELSRKKGCAVGFITCYQGAAMIQAFMPKEILQKPEYQIPAEKRHIDLHFAWNADAYIYEMQFLYFVPFSFTRVLWYQGESNGSDAEAAVYYDMLTDMIAAWRRDLRDEALPFTVVQIADTKERLGPAWRTVQAAQLKAGQTVPFVTTVVSADISETDDIHPPTKGPLGKRIAESFEKC